MLLFSRRYASRLSWLIFPALPEEIIFRDKVVLAFENKWRFGQLRTGLVGISTYVNWVKFDF